MGRKPLTFKRTQGGHWHLFAQQHSHKKCGGSALGHSQGGGMGHLLLTDPTGHSGHSVPEGCREKSGAASSQSTATTSR